RPAAGRLRGCRQRCGPVSQRPLDGAGTGNLDPLTVYDERQPAAAVVGQADSDLAVRDLDQEPDSAPAQAEHQPGEPARQGGGEVQPLAASAHPAETLDDGRP